jgi:hypothetical protein
LRVDDRLDPRTYTLADYQHAGYQYLVVNVERANGYRTQGARYPREASFYQDVDCHTRLIAAFAPTTTLTGWHINVYQLLEPPRRVFGDLCR